MSKLGKEAASHHSGLGGTSGKLHSERAFGKDTVVRIFMSTKLEHPYLVPCPGHLMSLQWRCQSKLKEELTAGSYHPSCVRNR